MSGPFQEFWRSFVVLIVTVFFAFLHQCEEVVEEEEMKIRKNQLDENDTKGIDKTAIHKDLFAVNNRMRQQDRTTTMTVLVMSIKTVIVIVMSKSISMLLKKNSRSLPQNLRFTRRQRNNAS